MSKSFLMASLMNSTTTTTIFTVEYKGQGRESGVFTPSEYLVSTEVQKIVEIALDFCLTFIISLTGIANNVIVIIVFAKQGFKDSANISMTSIAIWDLAKCLAGAMQRMSGPIELFGRADAESWTNVGTVAFNYFICFSSYVSGVLAAFVAVERCLCVSMPFKVKGIFTPKFTFIVCSTISVVVFSSFGVMWSIYDIAMVHDPQYNRSIFIYRYNEFYESSKGVLFIYYNMSGIVWPAVSFGIISICTVIIVVQLRKSSKFRSSGLGDTSGKGEAKLSQRDRQIVKMLLVIIALYIGALAPRIAWYLAKYFIYELYFLRLYHNIFVTISYGIIFLDLINATVNLYVFIFMSSSFRSTFLSLFWCCRSAK